MIKILGFRSVSRHERGASISIDPNRRPPMTTDPDGCQTGIVRFLQIADLVKFNDEDLEYLHPEWTD